MSDTPEIAAIRARWQPATPGPWIDLTASYFARMEAYRKRTGKWWHGTRLDSLPVVLIAQAQHHGEPLNVEEIPERVDYWDLNKVIAWRWGMLPMRTKEISEGFFSPEDAAAIAAAPADIATLLAALDEAQAQMARDAPVLAAVDALMPYLHRYPGYDAFIFEDEDHGNRAALNMLYDADARLRSRG